jgi:hypothetical protein
MNHYIMIRRLRNPAILLLIGVLALLDQLSVIDHFWRWFVPLLMILLGVLMLAERAMLAAGGLPQGPYPGQPYGSPYPGSTLDGSPQAPTTGSPASAQAFAQDSGKEPGGGQL